MASEFFDNPPILNGKEAEQLKQLQAYLGMMSNKLNEALMAITIEQMAPEAQVEIRDAGKETAQKNYTALKSMIVKTAEIVRSEMDEITARLEANYTALSDQFGTYEQNLTSEITATAEGILQNYNYTGRIETLEADDASTQSFITRTNQYIYSGLVYEEDGHPYYGIAIGENVTNTDGTLNHANKKATFTMEKLSFWQGETEIAYFSNGMFFITKGEITKTLVMGNFTWQVILPDKALGLMANYSGS